MVQELSYFPQIVRKIRTDFKEQSLSTKTFLMYYSTDVIRLYDDESTLFYCDPPYLHATRGDGKAYGFEMNEELFGEMEAAYVDKSPPTVRTHDNLVSYSEVEHGTIRSAVWFLQVRRPTYAKPQDASYLGVLCHQPKGSIGQPFFFCQVLSLGDNSP